MKKSLSICTIVLVAIVAFIYVIKSDNVTTMPHTSPTSSLTLASSAFDDGATIPALYTCKGKDLSPPLYISGVPSGTKSLTLTLEDPDTSIGTFDHWVVFNIDPSTSVIAEGMQPNGILGKGTSGETAYVSPCPPSGIHHYIFSLYAVDTRLPLSFGVTKQQVLEAMKGHIIGTTRLVGMFGAE